MDTILDPTKNYIVLDASKQLLILDVHDVRRFAIKAGICVVYGGVLYWSAFQLRKDWRERQQWKAEEQRQKARNKEYEEALREHREYRERQN